MNRQFGHSWGKLHRQKYPFQSERRVSLSLSTIYRLFLKQITCKFSLNRSSPSQISSFSILPAFFLVSGPLQNSQENSLDYVALSEVVETNNLWVQRQVEDPTASAHSKVDFAHHTPISNHFQVSCFGDFSSMPKQREANLNLPIRVLCFFSCLHSTFSPFRF